MVVVCDTNVLISALIFPGGPPDKIFRTILAGQVRHATSPDILGEVKKVLEKKFKTSSSKVQEVVELISNNSDLIYPTERLNIVKTDPTDNRVLECAFFAKAQYLITGDKKDLIPLGRYNATTIIAPKDFCIELGII